MPTRPPDPAAGPRTAAPPARGGRTTDPRITDPHTIELPVQTRGDVRLMSETADAERRSVELVWSTGAAVRRRDPRTGRRYDEVLSLEEPICRELAIAPSTYHAHAAHRADPSKASARAWRDALLRGHVRRVWEENFRSAACARSGANSAAKASRLRDARSPA